MVDITVVIPTYNRCKSLEATLKSLIEQENNEKLSWEVIVVDNNSTDKTKEAVEGFKGAFAGNLIYLFEPRQGRTFALNKGIESAKGEIIAMTDDDCIADRNWLANIWKAFSTKNIDLLAGKVIAVFDSELPSWLDINALHGPLAHHDKGDKYFDNDDSQKILTTGANMILRRTSVEKFGNFHFHGRAEDTELAYRWGKLGAKIAYSPTVIVRHYNDPARLTKNYFRKWYFLGGKNYAILFKDKYSSRREFFKIPCWIYRGLISSVLHYLKCLCLFRKDTFYYEAYFYYYAGLIAGYHGYTTKFENLR